MSDLKRDFHGCLTCRKRKVKCKGGNPCANCVRAKVACDSSFDDNIRMVAGPSGSSSRKRKERETESQSVSDNNVRRSPTVSLDMVSQSSALALPSIGPASGELPNGANIPLIPDTLVPSNISWDLGFSLEPYLNYTFPFDLPFEAQPSTTETPVQLDLEALFGPIDEQSEEPDDAFYFDYFERRFGGTAFTLKGNGKWNYHNFILDFIRGPHCPANSALRFAVLAWTAKHCSTRLGSSSSAWRKYRDQALAGLAGTLPGPSGGILTSGAETYICSTLFLCRCDILNNDIPSVLTHLSRLRERLDELLGPPAAKPRTSLSSFASKVLLWLCYLHIRVLIFCTPPPETSTTILDALIGRFDYVQILAHSHGYLQEIFGDTYPMSELKEDRAKITISVRTHEVYCLLRQILLFRARMAAWSAKKLAVDSEAIELDIKRIETSFAADKLITPSAGVLDLASPAKASRPTDSLPAGISNGSNGNTSLPLTESSTSRIPLHWLSTYASFLSAIILWSRVRQPSGRSDQQAAAAVSGITHIALHLREILRSDKTSVSSGFQNLASPLHSETSVIRQNEVLRFVLSPMPLFMAGIETTDEVYAEWITQYMAEIGGELPPPPDPATIQATSPETRDSVKGATNGVLMTQNVLARVRQRQADTGTRIDPVQIMSEFLIPGQGQALII